MSVELNLIHAPSVMPMDVKFVKRDFMLMEAENVAIVEAFLRGVFSVTPKSAVAARKNTFKRTKNVNFAVKPLITAIPA